MTVKRKHEMGAGGFCVCAKCGAKISHRDGIPCQEERCPACDARLLREGSEHHSRWLDKQARRRRQAVD